MKFNLLRHIQRMKKFMVVGFSQAKLASSEEMATDYT
jgi:hypothetical protein